MSITVINGTSPTYPLTVDNMRDGHAYESQDGDIYIANHYDEVYAVSICGNLLAFNYSMNRFREVNLEIRVV